MIKKALIPAIALVAASVALPAAAQHYDGNRGHNRGYERGYERDHRDYRDHDRGWQSINQRQAQLDRRIDQAVRYGSISRREAQGLREEFRRIARLEAQYRRGGLSRWERQDLDRRFDRLSARIRMEQRDRDGRRG